MAFLSKLAFWKKKDDIEDLGKDLGLGKELGLDIGTVPSPDLGMGLEQQQQPWQKYPSFQQPQQGFQPVPSLQQPSFGSNDNFIASKNLEVISSKLDALRALLESVNQRLANIEAIARGEQQEQRRKYY